MVTTNIVSLPTGHVSGEYQDFSQTQLDCVNAETILVQPFLLLMTDAGGSDGLLSL